MDIVTINNQVVAMRGAVKQAKVHTVRKLIRQAKSLRAKKGNEDQLTKNGRKADRIVKEISTIRELKNDEVSKFALTNRHTSKTLPKEMAADLFVLCMTKLSEHKAVMSSVNKCRKKFDNWEKELPQLLKMCEIRKLFKLTHQPPGRIRTRSKKKSKSKLAVGSLSITQPESQVSNWDSDHDDAPRSDDYYGPEGTSPAHEPDHFKPDCDSFVDGGYMLRRNNVPDESFVVSDNQSSKETVPREILNEKKADVVKKPKAAVQPVHEKESLQNHVEKPIIVQEKRIGDMEVKRFVLSAVQEQELPDDEQLSDGEQLSSNIVSSITHNDNKRAKTKSTDNFFVRNDNDGQSDVDVPSSESNEEEVECDKSAKASRPNLESTFIGSLRHGQPSIFPSDHRKPNKIHNREWQRPQQTKFGDRPVVQERRPFGREGTYSHKPSGNPNRKERRQMLSQEQNTVSLAPTAIHPSWDAKRKLKMQSQIHQFQGKKIKFDD